jgi:diacylglycerol kinase family enzyme
LRIKLIYNPMAGRGRVSRHRAEAERYLRELGDEVDVHAKHEPGGHDASRCGCIAR